MVTRIVKLTFKPECIEEFMVIFNYSKTFIASFEGNCFISLMRDSSNENVFFTISQWQAIENLESYRNSPYFKEVWAETKILFADKPRAWTLDKIETIGLWQN